MIDSRRVRGGKTVYGATVGVLMLETRFPRIPGDIGNGATWPFPVLYKVVRGATARRVSDDAEGLLPQFLEAAAELVADGVDGITTNCGFLSLFQDRLAQHCAVPVAASALMQIPLVQSLLPPGRRVGVVTANAATMHVDHLRAACAAEDTPVAGIEMGRELSHVLHENRDELDGGLAEADVIDACYDLHDRHPNVGAIVLECTNLVPYARAASEAVGLPVFDIYTFLCWFQAGLSPRGFGHPG